LGLFYCIALAEFSEGKFVPESKARILPRAALFAAAVFAPVCFALTVRPSPQALANNPVPTHEVVDELGRTVRIPVNPTRIISLAPSLTETVYALGADDRLVGDTDYCDYPPAAQKKPKVGGVIDPNLEQIVALRPDLVLVTKDSNRPETVRALENFGIPSYATAPRKVKDIITSTEKLAEVLNVSAAGKTVADDMERRLATLQSKLSGVPPRRVLFVVWMEPLISVGQDTFVADAIIKAGAVSIVDSSQDWPQISMEEVAHLQPDFLVFAPSHTQTAAQSYESLANLPGWSILTAVREHHIAVASDAIIRPAPRMISAIEDLARQLHPQAFGSQPPQEKPAPNSPALFLFEPAVAYPANDSMESSCAR
jgi:iron complex transport system substrate-binding protein